MKKKKSVTKRDILFTCQYFYPDRNSSATLPYDTAKFFADCGYKVDVLCGYPKEYFDGKTAPLKEVVDGIHIRRIPYIQSRRVGKLGRIINYLSFTLGILIQLNILKKYRCVICYSNPPILPLAVVRYAKLFGTKVVFVAYDLYPEVAYASSSIRKGSLIDHLMGYVNREVYKHANTVIALSEEMRDFILDKRSEIDSNRVTVIHNWAHEENEAEQNNLSNHSICNDISNSGDKTFTKNGNLANELKIAYFGNMGTCQDIETLLQAAKETDREERFVFEFIGSGNKKDRIKHFTREMNLSNIRVHDYVTGELFKKELQDSTCCVVSLIKGLRGMCAPSKYYTYLYAGKPIIAIMEEDSYIAKEVSDEKIGYAISNGDIQGIIKAVKNIQSNPSEMKTMGEKAIELYQKKYCYREAMSKYLQVIEDLIKN